MQNQMFTQTSLRGYGPLVALSEDRDDGIVPAPSVGVWDQCLKFGVFRKRALNGEMTTTIFDEVTVGQMMDYFRDHENDLWMDSQHGILRGKGQALCYHNALVMVSKGQIIRFECKGDQAPNTPTLEDLRRPNGKLPGDGLFAYRYQLTTLGTDPKEGIRVFKWVSPFFEQLETGYRLINITATNDPFLDGVALAYENGPADAEQKEHTMDDMKKYMEAAGCKPDDSPEEKLKKMTAYMKKMDEQAEAEKDKAMARKKMNDEPTKEDKDPKPDEKTLSRRKMDEEPKDKDQDDAEAAEEDQDDKKDKALSRKKMEEAKADPDQASDSEDKPKDSYQRKAMARMIYRDLGLSSDPEMAREEIKQLRTLPRQISDLRKRMEITEEDRAKEKRLVMEREAGFFAENALRQKRWRIDHKGSEKKTRDWLAQAYMRNPKEAEEMLQPPGTFGVVASVVMERYTEGGAPYGVQGRAEKKGVGLGSDLNHAALQIQMEQEEKTKKSFPYDRALAMAERQHPHLAQAYSREVFDQESDSWR